MSQGNVREEEDTGRNYHYTNIETGVSGSNRIIVGMGSRSTCTVIRSQKPDNTKSTRMCRTDE
jgi:hypothetical protein